MIDGSVSGVERTGDGGTCIFVGDTEDADCELRDRRAIVEIDIGDTGHFSSSLVWGGSWSVRDREAIEHTDNIGSDDGTHDLDAATFGVADGASQFEDRVPPGSGNEALSGLMGIRAAHSSLISASGSPSSSRRAKPPPGPDISSVSRVAKARSRG